MDNKITKARLSNFLSYEWIIMIIVAVAAIFAWDILYTTTTVRLNYGQSYVYYLDYSVASNQLESFNDNFTDGTFSYDVQEITYEQMSDTVYGGYDVLTLRLTLPEGDMVYTSICDDEDGNNRAKALIDLYNIYDRDLLLSNAKDYLSQFLKSGVSGENAVFDFENMDKAKIENRFLETKKKDNRYRWGKISVENEYERIEKLCSDVAFYNGIVQYDSGLSEEDSIFYSYRKYEQTYNIVEDKTKYESLYNNSVAKKYGLKLSKLKNGQKDISNYIVATDSRSVNDVVLLTFNFSTDKNDGIYDLQFETISYINTLIKTFSDITV